MFCAGVHQMTCIAQKDLLNQNIGLRFLSQERSDLMETALRQFAFMHAEEIASLRAEVVRSKTLLELVVTVVVMVGEYDMMKVGTN